MAITKLPYTSLYQPTVDASTPLAGTETVVVIQSGVAKNVDVSDLTSGTDVSSKSITLSDLTADTFISSDASKTIVSVTGSASTPLAGTETVAVMQSGSPALATVSELMQSNFGANLILESGTTRTLSATDSNRVILCTSGSAVTISCPDGLSSGFNCTIIQLGAGTVTLAASGTATLNSYSGLFSTMGQYAVISVLNVGSDAFVAAGNLGV